MSGSDKQADKQRVNQQDGPLNKSENSLLYNPLLYNPLSNALLNDDLIFSLKNAFFDELGIKLGLDEVKDIMMSSVSEPKKEFGDLTINPFVVLSLLKKKDPNIKVDVSSIVRIVRDIIVKLMDESRQDFDFIEKVEVVNNYINISFKPNFVVGLAIEKCVSGCSLVDKKNSKVRVLIEHTSINPSGPINVGRIRNSFIGDTLMRVFKELGFRVRTHYYVNDVGKQVAIITVAKQEGIKEDEGLKQKFSNYKNRPDFKTMFIYVPANKKYEEDDDFKKKVEELLKRCESGDKEALNSMKQTALYCLEGQKKTLKRFSIDFDSFDFESDFLESGKTRYVIERMKGLREYVVVDGNHALNLERYGFKSRFGGMVFQRANGTSVYLSRDVAYHIWKKELADKMITVLGEDHKVEFKVLKQILKLLGVIKDDSELEVVHFAFVGLKEGKLSTRKGLVIPVDEVLDNGIKKVLELMSNRIKGEEKEKILIAEKIAASAIRYSELKIAPSKQILFDWESALRFDGQTGPYLQYALVRANKIIKKAVEEKGINEEELIKEAKLNNIISDITLDSWEEKELSKKILDLKRIVEETARKRSPHLLANYAFELAERFSKFYEKNTVINAEENIMKQRLMLVLAFRNVLRKVLYLLGIEEVQEM